MNVYVAGRGKLAQALLNDKDSSRVYTYVSWDDRDWSDNEKSVVIHAGSGRQRIECMNFCSSSGSVYVELATGMEMIRTSIDFPMVICPNTSVLMLKVMAMLNAKGDLFKGVKRSILESHQSAKTTVPATAQYLAESIYVPPSDILSIRDAEYQSSEHGISNEYLDKHAYHKLTMQDGMDEVSIELKVLGLDSYVRGTARIVEAVVCNVLENREYSVFELIERGWL